MTKFWTALCRVVAELGRAVKGPFRRYEPKHKKIIHYTIVDWTATMDGFGWYGEPVFGGCGCPLEFDHDENGNWTTPV